MCGINGIYNFSNSGSAPLEPLVSTMNQLIRHRGPDDHGIWTHETGRLCMGHQRLSILDLSAAGHQPMKGPEGSVIVYNGEIYNYRTLKKAVTQHSFQSESDTEVLLCLLQQKGKAVLPELNGMFAFACWNEQTQTLLLARDRAGKKPLYYTVSNGRFIFSSELKSILSVPGVQKEINDEQLYHFLTFNQVSAPYTLFRNIYKLLPGEWLTVDNNGELRKDTYTRIQYQDLRGISEEILAGDILSSFRKSVEYRMIADVPVGAFLSGGVDSSAVVATMTELTPHPIKTFTIGFEGQEDYNELNYAEGIAKRFGTDHHVKMVKQDDLLTMIDRMADIFDDPVGDATAIPIYFIAELAKQQGTIVVLSGDGSDELFAGYHSWVNYRRLYPYYNLFLQLPTPLRKLAGLLGGSGDNARSEIFHRAAAGQEFFWGGAKSFKESYKRKLLSDAWQKNTAGLDSYAVIQQVKEEFNTYKRQYPWLEELDWMSFLGYRQQIPTRYLHRMDKLGMAHGIEVRCPFLDDTFADLALSVPAALKIKNGIPKYLLKKSFEPLLDHDTLYRKKMGFCVPLKAWAGAMMTDYIEQHFHGFCANTGYFHEGRLRAHLQGLSAGNNDSGNDIWTIYFLMAWFNKWM